MKENSWSHFEHNPGKENSCERTLDTEDGLGGPVSQMYTLEARFKVSVSSVTPWLLHKAHGIQCNYSICFAVKGS